MRSDRMGSDMSWNYENPYENLVEANRDKGRWKGWGGCLIATGVVIGLMALSLLAQGGSIFHG
jgi:hypothetical protein